ncbi:MAG: helix-turn-helix domain-containing protein [Terriglobales bacterium]
MNKQLAKLLQYATRRRAEATLLELFEIFELNTEEGTLAKVFLVERRLAELGLKLVPGIEIGEIETVRRVELAEQLLITEADVLEDLRRREAEDLELKSSLLYDHARAKKDPSATAMELKSEAVLYSGLRTIAAFLTCTGGVLYIGIDDSGAILGIEYDFPCITSSKEKQNADHWELHLRNCIQGRFKEGENINDYVSCGVMPINGKLIARIEVAPRAKLSFLLSKQGNYSLYRRQGNRTVEVPIELIEEFIEVRKPFLEAR